MGNFISNILVCIGTDICTLYIHINLGTVIFIFYAMETYIMHFLETAGFLNAPDLTGRKVNAGRKVYFTPRCGSLCPAVGV